MHKFPSILNSRYTEVAADWPATHGRSVGRRLVRGWGARPHNGEKWRGDERAISTPTPSRNPADAGHAHHTPHVLPSHLPLTPTAEPALPTQQAKPNPAVLRPQTAKSPNLPRPFHCTVAADDSSHAPPCPMQREPVNTNFAIRNITLYIRLVI